MGCVRLRLLVEVGHGFGLRPDIPTFSGAGRLKPAADVDLCVRFSAIMASARRVGVLFCPLIDGQMRAAAIDDEPANRLFALLATNFTSIDGIDHRATSQKQELGT